jgi:Cu+-exporting ATPase
MGPVLSPVPCSGCGKLIDPLRAGHVAIFDLRFHYFCNATTCRWTYLGQPGGAAPEPLLEGLFDPRAAAAAGAEPRRFPRPEGHPISAAIPEARRPPRRHNGEASPEPSPQQPASPQPTTSRPDLSPSPPSPVTPSARQSRAEFDARIVDAFEQPPEDSELPRPPGSSDDRSLVEPIARTILSEGPARLDAPEARDVGALLLVIAIVAGGLAALLALAGEATLVLGARLVLAAVGAGMLVGRSATTVRDAADPHPLPLLAAPVGALLVGIWAALGADRALAAEAASLAGIVVTGAAVSGWLSESARRQVVAERAWIDAELTVPGRRVPEEVPSTPPQPSAAPTIGPAGGRSAVTTPKCDSFDLRPGEQVLVEPGEVVPVDLTVTGGEVEILPWIGATTSARRREGDSVVAGATVVHGRLRGVCTWSGTDRAFARVLLDPRRRGDALAPIAQASRSLVERWAVVAAAIGAVSALLGARLPIEIAMTTVAVHAALATSITATIASVHVARGVLLALRRGITYKSADAWHRAGRVGVAMFNARGTLLLGEPELAELASLSPKLQATDVLALAAGAERTEEHPLAMAIVRAAKTRGVRPDGVRNPHLLSGLGVTAVTSTGEELCVGNRALMLEQRISIASAEQRIGELEGLGRTVVLVAVGARLVGLLGLQDGLRPGARAAVQHLLDAQIEPALMSGDARETCEAIARSLDIDHIRPEVLPADRAAEVRRLIDAGMSVAVLGHAGVDEAALGAADVAVALAAAGSTPGDFAVALASDDVRDAALALALAHRTRIESSVAVALAVVPALVGGVAVAFGILPPAYAPIASLLGGGMAVAHSRALERTAAPPTSLPRSSGE